MNHKYSAMPTHHISMLILIWRKGIRMDLAAAHKTFVHHENYCKCYINYSLEIFFAAIFSSYWHILFRWIWNLLTDNSRFWSGFMDRWLIGVLFNWTYSFLSYIERKNIVQFKHFHYRTCLYHHKRVHWSESAKLADVPIYFYHPNSLGFEHLPLMG